MMTLQTLKNFLLLIKWYFIILPLIKGIYLRIILSVWILNISIISLSSWLILINKLIILILPYIENFNIITIAECVNTTQAENQKNIREEQMIFVSKICNTNPPEEEQMLHKLALAITANNEYQSRYLFHVFLQHNTDENIIFSRI